VGAAAGLVRLSAGEGAREALRAAFIHLPIREEMVEVLLGEG
jgi:hypothetical protein